MTPFFSILVVCLNPGNKLKATIESIAGQTYGDYEILIKDGGSADESVSYVETLLTQSSLPVRLLKTEDRGIYDAMNQAAAQAAGSYVYFLNCGDTFYDEKVLERMAEKIKKNPASRGIYYGNIYERLTGQRVASNPRIDAFACYRNVPCHQACFYDRALLMAHPFDLSYSVRADYEQFLWCYFTDAFPEKVRFVYTDMTVADYEGGGFSEKKENRKLSQREHKEITRKYMSNGQIQKYRLMLWLTLAPLRTLLAENEKTAGLYNGLKDRLYRRK
jgi:glycosyltransferase involved in cell wall biosynthesis